MSHAAAEPASLRERKKLRLRRGLQQIALRLFADQGYEQTTVEQIVTEAESSLATFYRHFPTKEDVVLYDEFDPLIEQAIARQPADETVTGTIRAAVAALARAVEADREQSLTRLRLILAVPALMARQALDERKNYQLYARALAARTGRPDDDYQLRLTIAALSAALTEAARYWAEHDGTPKLTTLMNQAVTTLDPLLSSLQPASSPVTAEAAPKKIQHASQDRR